MIFVDGVDIGDVTDVALRDRRMLSRRRHLRRRRHDLRAGRLVRRRARDHPARRAVPRRGREAARRDPRDRRALARPRRRRARSARSTCCRRCSTTTSPSSSTSACAAGRWCCRSSSRSRQLAASRRGDACLSPAAGARPPLPRMRAVPAGSPSRSLPAGRRRSARRRAGVLERHVPPCDVGDRAHDRRGRGRTTRRGRPLPRTKRSKTRSRSSRRHAGAVVLDDQRGRPRRPARPTRRRDARARRRVAQRVLHEVERPFGAARRGRPRRSPGATSSVELVAARPPARARPPPRRRPGAGRSGGAAHLRRRGVGAREQQQVADEPAHPLRRAQRAAGGLAVLAVERLGEQLEVGEHARQRRAQLVRGVGDELRAGGRSIASVSSREAASAASIWLSVRASSATSSSASDRRHVPVRVARSRRSPARSRSAAAIGGIALRADDRPATSASSAPPSTPSARNSAHAVDRALDLRERPARTARTR